MASVLKEDAEYERDLEEYSKRSLAMWKCKEEEVWPWKKKWFKQ